MVEENRNSYIFTNLMNIFTNVVVGGDDDVDVVIK